MQECKQKRAASDKPEGPGRGKVLQPKGHGTWQDDDSDSQSERERRGRSSSGRCASKWTRGLPCATLMGCSEPESDHSQRQCLKFPTERWALPWRPESRRKFFFDTKLHWVGPAQEQAGPL
jgi:hypothetical protein